MLRTVVGVPRSGKSYYLVQYLLKFCNYDPISRTWDLKPRHMIVTNIDGLKINTQNFDLMLSKASDLDLVPIKKYSSETEQDYIRRKGLVNFFHVPTWERLSKRYDKIIVAIDEIQKYLPSFDRTIPNSVFYWFEYHGHFGAELFVMSQAAESVHRRVLAINETFLEAQSPSMRVKSNLLKYTLRDSQSNEVVGSEFLATDDKVFKAYKSARHQEGIKERKTFITKYWIYAAVIASIIPLAGYWFFSSFQAIADRGKPIKEANAGEVVPQPAELKKVSQPESLTEEPHPIIIKPFNRSNVMRWSYSGVTPNDIESFPESCEIFSGYVRCPPYSLPSGLKKVAVNYVCPPKQNNCFIYFPIRKESTDDSELS